MKIMSVSASSCSSLTLRWRDSRSDRSRPDILCSSATLPTSLQEVSFKYGPIHSLELDAKQLGRGARYYVMKKRFPTCHFAISKDQELPNELENDVLEQENDVLEQENDLPANDVSTSDPSFVYEGSGGRPGLLSFYSHHRSGKNDVLVPITDKNQHSLLWFVAPAVLVASFIFPSLYLRQILSTIFEDSLLTDFLILFFTEALFYFGVAVYLQLVDFLNRKISPVSSGNVGSGAALKGHKISSGIVLVLSLIIPMVTMGFVWPWTGPAASATLAPYLVGIVVQYTFEQYARYRKSPSFPVIPVIFQVYRLHQLNRAAQLVTALSFTVKGADMTPQNLAISGSLSTLLSVLQILGVICIWSLSSFVMRYLPSSTMPE